jgi:Tfp pilus assembly protein PilN
VRPVNLIPPEERQGDRAPMRTGFLPYVLLGALTFALIGVIVMTLTSKQISDREDEKVSLEQNLAHATQRAESLRAFADFRAAQEARSATVSSLAESRFDWERVMSELSRVIPDNVWLLKMTGTVSPSVQVQDGAEVTARDTVEGPALEIVGCTVGQDDVAGFLAALEDIDGVTRVGLASSGLGEEAATAAAPSDTDTAATDCRTREFIYQFEIVVAFDAVPAPETATTAPSVPSAVAPATGAPTPEQTADAQQATDVLPSAGG